MIKAGVAGPPEAGLIRPSVAGFICYHNPDIFHSVTVFKNSQVAVRPDREAQLRTVER